MLYTNQQYYAHFPQQLPPMSGLSHTYFYTSSLQNPHQVRYECKKFKQKKLFLWFQNCAIKQNVVPSFWLATKV